METLDNKEVNYSLHNNENFKKELDVDISDVTKKISQLFIDYYKFIIENIKLEKTYLAVGFRICKRDHSDYFLLDILRIILCGNMSSLLFVELREKNGLTYTVNIDFDAYENVGNFIILTNVDKKRLITSYNKPGALNIIFKILKRLREKGVTSKQLKIAKGYLKGIMSLSLDDTANISYINGIRHLFNQREKNISLDKIYKEKYHSITVSQVNRVIKKYLKKSNLACAFLGPNIKNKKAKIKEICKKL